MTATLGEQETVETAIQRARQAAAWWSGLGFRGRRERLLAFKHAIADGVDDLAAVVSAETGKPTADAVLEVMLAVENLDWAARHAPKVLRRRRVGSGILAANQASTVEYHPLGVVAAIGPWNYPVYTPLGAIASALAAGNTVVFKPSEFTPHTGEWLAAAWPGPQPVLQTVTGDGAVGAALCRAGVDKVTFTGSAATGRRVMAACAETLTPVVIEGGGKDAMIVAADADLGAAVRAAAFGGFGNAGQTCAGVERVYVVREVYPDFLSRLAELAETVRPGEPDGPYGRMTTEAQVEIVRRHIGAAVEAGARPVVGGPASVTPPFISPVVLAEAPEDNAAVTEETFGPTLVVNPVDSLDEAIARANATRYGLAASVFSRDQRKAVAVARRLRTGAVSINSVLGFAAVPALPFGGVGDSGFGRVHGADGLREFSRAQSMTRQRFAPPIDLMRLDRSATALHRARAAFRLRHASRGKATTPHASPDA
ncbi:aldehyde dehydrogenase family protein [Actinoplanes sp. CA-054009]